eukprot:CAMPEP_0119136338 /NCGR_PEP_ID=MMETSP1310-20130426/21212_1 /TAXON_ID=464262 /ORGANISM="Genus nov. species nov., Strain RCC2339" /LENGTH=254 /DNA_ID=CAMNT_0007127321 /DNA_START=25 /DNA_END=786 /DNA_ORIENTATION=-
MISAVLWWEDHFVEPLFWGLAIVLVAVAYGSPLLRQATSYGLRQTGDEHRSWAALPWVLRVVLLPIPSRWVFGTYYALSLALNASAWGVLVLFVSSVSARTCLLPALLSAHAARRLAEVLWVHVYSTTSSSPLLTYACGCTFYVFVVLAWVLNSPLVGRWAVDAALPLQLAGVALFILCSAVQHHCHRELARLRERPDARSKYSYPRSFWFRQCLTPHYLAECGIYTSFCATAHVVLPGLRFALIFTLLNLSLT